MAYLIVLNSVLSSVSGLSRGVPKRGALRSVGVLPFRCNLRGDSTNSRGGKEPLEILFAKELKRRGIDSTSPTVKGSYSSLAEESNFEEDLNGARNSPKKNRAASAWLRSTEPNNDRLEDLIPRARLILATGATFFLGFWPLILLTMGIFSAMDHYFGPVFVHRAHHAESSGPHRVGPTDV